MLAQSDEQDLAQKDLAQRNLTSVQPKNVSTIRINPPGGSESSSIGPLITPVAQRAILYEEDPTDSKGKRYAGGVTWRTENISPASGMPPELVVKADLPEVEPKDIDVRVENQTLTIAGERKFQDESHDKGYHRIERSYGNFVRSFAVPNTFDTDKINAAFKNGVLTVTLTKK